MARLEVITKDASVRAVLANNVVKIIDSKFFGSDALKIVYEASNWTADHQSLYRDRESTPEIVESGRPQSFTGDGNLLRMVSEAKRIQRTCLFEPLLAAHT